jgi:hypothetical protein
MNLNALLAALQNNGKPKDPFNMGPYGAINRGVAHDLAGGGLTDGSSLLHGGTPAMIQRQAGSVSPLTGYHVNAQHGNPRRGKVYRTIVHGDGTRTHVYEDGTRIRMRAPGEHNTTDLTGGVQAPTEQPQGIPFVSEDPAGAQPGQQLPPALANALRRALGR